MAREMQNNTMSIEQAPETLQNSDIHKNLDDDGRPKRTGSVTTASAHIITAVIGSGVLSLAWAIAQLGWVVGLAVLMAFSFITFFTSTLLADCYRAPDPVTGTRNYTYMDVVRAHLGGIKVQLCGIAQYCNLVGVTIGYTITASISMVAVKRSNCFHKHGHYVKCSISNYPFMIIFASIQIILSQIPNFHELSWLSIVAAIMSFAYSSIGLGLSIAKVAGGGHARTSLTGVTVGVDVSGSEKVWRSFQAIGDIAFAYAYSTVLIEIQDTLKSHPPENKVMKRASLVGVTTTTLFYILCGSFGYAAFGNKTPGNFPQISVLDCVLFLMGEREKLSVQKVGKKFLQDDLELQVCSTINNPPMVSITLTNQNHGHEEISSDRSATGDFQFGVGSSVVTVACSC